MTKFVLIALALVASAAAKEYLVSNSLNSELNEEWNLYKAAHGKTYNAPEETIRRLIWEENLRFIQSHNLAYSRGEKMFTVGMNKYGDLTPLEFKQKFNGYRAPANRTKGSTFLSSSIPFTLPDSVDWRTKGYVTPVKDQKQCGSCWAFSTTGSLEGQMFKKTGKLVSLSEQSLVDCSQSFGNNGCDGGLMDYAFAYIKQNGGIDTEQCYPYKAVTGNVCKYKASCKSGEDTGFTDITSGSESELQEASATIGPISVGIDASQPSFQLYQSGVYDEPDCSSTQLDHGVLVVGYGTFEGKDYWLVKNSWGASWGLKGFIMMSRNKNNQCGIATSASYPLV